MSKIMRIPDDCYELLEQLAKSTGQSKLEIIRQAVQELKKKLFFHKVNVSYENLKKNKKAWQEELEERKEWESFNDIDKGIKEKYG